MFIRLLNEVYLEDRSDFIKFHVYFINKNDSRTGFSLLLHLGFCEFIKETYIEYLYYTPCPVFITIIELYYNCIFV